MTQQPKKSLYQLVAEVEGANAAEVEKAVRRVLGINLIDAHQKDDQGNTRLHEFLGEFAAEYNGGGNDTISSNRLSLVLKAFSDMNADFNARNNQGETPLDLVRHINGGLLESRNYGKAFEPYRKPVPAASPAVAGLSESESLGPIKPAPAPKIGYEE